MKTRTVILIALLAGFSAAEAPAQSQPAAAEAPEWRITEKDVAAVQAELLRRGYLKTKPNGKFDRETREAVSAYQADNRLRVTGRIDRATFNHLGLIHLETEPVASNRPGALSKVGGGVKETTAGAGRVMGGAARKMGDGARVGLEKTWDAGSAVASKSKGAAEGAGRGAARGAKSVGRSARRGGNALFNRDDADIHAEITDMLNLNPATRGWHFDVKSGLVTLKAPRGHRADLGAVVSDLRKIVGVKSVFVIAL